MSGKIDPNEVNQDTDTDMYVEMIANQDKLITEKRRWEYADGNSDSDSDDENRKIGDSINNYKKSDKSEKSSESDTDKSSETETDRSSETEKSKPSASLGGGFRDLSKEQARRKKLDMLRKLYELKENGASISKNYNMKSDYSEMEDEYNFHRSIRSKSNALTLMGHMLVGCVTGIQMLNDGYNPFDIKLSGLSTKISDNMEPYYDVLGEIYEKYNKPGKSIAPELKLLMMIGGAAIQLQMGKFIPGMIKGQAEKINNDKDFISGLAKKAAQTSDRHRAKLNKSLQKDRDKMKKNMDDNTYLREKELEVKRVEQQDITSIKDLDFSESTEHPDDMTEEEKKLLAKNLAKKEKLQDMEMNLKRKISKNKLKNEGIKLQALINKINHDESDGSGSDDGTSYFSTESSLSENPKGHSALISKNRKKSPRNEKKKSRIKKSDVSIGSSKSSSSKRRKKKKSAIDIVLSKK